MQLLCSSHLCGNGGLISFSLNSQLLITTVYEDPLHPKLDLSMCNIVRG